MTEFRALSKGDQIELQVKVRRLEEEIAYMKRQLIELAYERDGIVEEIIDIQMKEMEREMEAQLHEGT